MAYLDRGDAYANKKDYDRAIADYTQAIPLKSGRQGRLSLPRGGGLLLTKRITTGNCRLH